MKGVPRKLRTKPFAKIYPYVRKSRAAYFVAKFYENWPGLTPWVANIHVLATGFLNKVGMRRVDRPLSLSTRDIVLLVRTRNTGLLVRTRDVVLLVRTRNTCLLVRTRDVVFATT